MGRLFNHPLVKAEAKHRKEAHEALQRERYENGDRTLKRTILGKIVKRSQGMVIESAEGLRFAHTNAYLPGQAGEIATSAFVATPSRPAPMVNFDPSDKVEEMKTRITELKQTESHPELGL